MTPPATSQTASSQADKDNILAPQEQTHVTPRTIFVDLVICGAFFALMFGTLKTHVPATNPFFVGLFGALTTLCLTGVVWVAIQMFRVVMAGEKRLKELKKNK